MLRRTVFQAQPNRFHASGMSHGNQLGTSRRKRRGHRYVASIRMLRIGWINISCLVVTSDLKFKKGSLYGMENV